MHTTKSGFTIVELLIVIVVIGILAAITIVAYNGIQDRANNNAVRSDIANFKKQLEIFRVDNSRYPNSMAELTATIGKVSSSSYTSHTNALTYCMEADRFAVGGASKSGQFGYYVRSDSGVTERAWWNVNSAQAICQSFGMTMGSGSYVSWGTPASPWLGQHIYP